MTLQDRLTLQDLAHELRMQCARHVNGVCQTHACLVSGGYVRDGEVDYSVATCKRHEQVLAIKSAGEARHEQV